MSVSLILDENGIVDTRYLPPGLQGGVSALNTLQGNITIAGGAGINVANSIGPPATITISQGAPVGGPYLPLAGGQMDFNPLFPTSVGVIEAHRITNLPTTDLDLVANAGHSVNIQTGGLDQVAVDTGALQVRATNGSVFESTAEFVPPPFYTYPNNPERGVYIHSWGNPTGFQQIGCEIDQITSATGEADGISVSRVRAGGGSDALGIKVDDIGLVPVGTNVAKGLQVRTINSAGISHGVDIQGVDGPVRSYGIQTQNINSAGNSVGYEATNITGGLDGRGAYFANVSGGANAYGVEMLSINAGTGVARGINIDATTSANNDAEGLRMVVIDAPNGTSSGVRVGSVSGLVANGGVINSVIGTNQAKGLEIDGTDSTAGNAEGIFLRNTTAAVDARGILVDAINATNSAFGAEFNNIVGGGDARGIIVSGPQGTTGIGVGIEINSVSGSSAAVALSINSATSTGVGSQAKGIECQNINGDIDTFGIDASLIASVSATATGILTSKITSATNSDAFGLYVDDVKAGGGNGFTHGVRIDNIDGTNGTGRTFGINMTNVNGNGPTLGLTLNNITTSGTSAATGINMTSVNGGGGLGTGIGMLVNTIAGARATGIDLQTISATTAQAIGLRVSNVSTAAPGVPAYGAILQRGAKLAGAAGQLLRVQDGNLGLSVQFLNDPVAPQIEPDGGNLVVIDAAAAVNVNLIAPVGGFQDGHWFYITKVGGGPHQIQDTNLADAFNAQPAGAPFAFGGPAFDSLLMFFFAGIWYANVF